MFAHILKSIDKRSDVDPADKQRAEQEYGKDIAYADPVNKKYPIDTEDHIRAAWNYINKPEDAGKYGDRDLKTLRGRIIAAWRKNIDKAGPPSA